MKKLLSFGINDYPESANDLRGCVFDTKNVSSTLGEVTIGKHGADTAVMVSKVFKEFGFDVRTILNSQATKKRFCDELSAMVLSAQKGDVIVIHYSGHGTQVSDKSGDESDGYDEALYLYDGPLIDDTINGKL